MGALSVKTTKIQSSNSNVRIFIQIHKEQDRSEGKDYTINLIHSDKSAVKDKTNVYMNRLFPRWLPSFGSVEKDSTKTQR